MWNATDSNRFRISISITPAKRNLFILTEYQRLPRRRDGFVLRYRRKHQIHGKEALEITRFHRDRLIPDIYLSLIEILSNVSRIGADSASRSIDKFSNCDISDATIPKT